MNAIEKLKARGWRVEQVGNKFLAVSKGQHIHDYDESFLYTKRELIHLCNSVYSTNIGKKAVKGLKNKALRRKSRQNLDNEDYFENKRGSKLDPWRYD